MLRCYANNDLSRQLGLHYDVSANRVDCFYNDMSKQLVSLFPALLDYSDSNSLLDETDTDFFESGLGGDITTSLTLSQVSQPYIVTRSIYVRYVLRGLHATQ